MGRRDAIRLDQRAIPWGENDFTQASLRLWGDLFGQTGGYPLVTERHQRNSGALSGEEIGFTE
jgi:hypothetical protein